MARRSLGEGGSEIVFANRKNDFESILVNRVFGTAFASVRTRPAIHLK
jgi:hypothetical protein